MPSIFSYMNALEQLFMVVNDSSQNGLFHMVNAVMDELMDTLDVTGALKI